MWVSRINAVSGCEFQELWQSANSLKRHVLLSGWHYATPWYEQLRIHQSPGRSQNSSPPPHLAVGWQDLDLLPTCFSTPNLHSFSRAVTFLKLFIFVSFLRTALTLPHGSSTNQRPEAVENSRRIPCLKVSQVLWTGGTLLIQPEARMAGPQDFWHLAMRNICRFVKRKKDTRETVWHTFLWGLPKSPGN